MNYRLLSAFCLVVISAYVHAEQLIDQSSPERSSVELSVELTDDLQVPLVPENEITQHARESLNAENIKDVQSSWVASLGQYTAQQMIACVAGSLIVGYGAYKAYQAFLAWCFPHSIQITAKDRDILLTLTETMRQDVKQVRTGGRKPSLVKGLSMSGLSSPLDIECRYWQQNFVMLYNQCETNTETIDLLDAFYADFNQAIKDLISKAKII